MNDIFGTPLEDYCIVSFPFINRGNSINSKVSVHLSYGVMKGKRVYTLDKRGLLVYKVMNSPETMVMRLKLADIPIDVMEKISIIRSQMEG